jgi:hypothetical protein
MSQQPNAPAAVEPTWTWGSSAVLSLSRALGLSQSVQLAQVTLPEPAVCSLYFTASARITDPAHTTVNQLTLNLIQGVGRVAVPRQVSFAGQPSDLSPIEWTMPFVPLHSLQVNVDASADLFFQAEGGEIDITMYFVISPITRIPQKIQKLQFGMALPGEADSMDDELLENLEGEAPSVAEIMGKEADHRVHGDDGDDDGGDEPQEAPAWMLDLVDALTQRLGRQPKRSELKAAVDRLRERQARRGR